MKQLGSATEESIGRLQHSLNVVTPYGLGIFEESSYESEITAGGIFQGEMVLMEKWKVAIEAVISQTQLRLPDWTTVSPVLGGRKGKHSEHLQPMLDEMGEVFRIDPTAEW